MSLSSFIKTQASELGFTATGISKADFLEKEARYLEKWLKDERHGKMEWMENHFDKRVDPRKLVDGAKSVISVIHNYFPGDDVRQDANAPKISKYAWGEDYHRVLKRKLYELAGRMQEEAGEFNFRIFTDSAPVMDKVWAARSGLGWIGKHTNLIRPQAGSWFFIGEIICDLELEYDSPVGDFCGSCTKCIDACPTDALTPYEIDSTKCISYLTIELREGMPDEFRGKTEGWAYGCDICQDVCPWNRFSRPEGLEFKPLAHLLEYSKADWLNLSKSQFNKLTRISAMSRIRHEKWMDNLDAVSPSEKKDI